MTQAANRTVSGENRQNPQLELTEKQNLALAELVKGASDAEAAKAASVRRQTVTDWKNHHPAFRAFLQNHRAEVWERLTTSMQDTANAALQLVKKTIDGGDVATARWYLEKISIDEVGKRSIEDMRSNYTTPAQELERKNRLLAEFAANMHIEELSVEDPCKRLDTDFRNRLVIEFLEAINKEQGNEVEKLAA